MKSSSAKECQRTKYAAGTNVQVAPVAIPAEVQDIPAQHTQDHEVVPGPTEVQGNPVKYSAEQLGSHTMDCDLDNHVHSALPDVHRGNTHADTVTNDGEPIGANNNGEVSRLTYGEDKFRPGIQRSENHTEYLDMLLTNNLVGLGTKLS